MFYCTLNRGSKTNSKSWKRICIFLLDLHVVFDLKIRSKIVFTRLKDWLVLACQNINPFKRYRAATSSSKSQKNISCFYKNRFFAVFLDSHPVFPSFVLMPRQSHRWFHLVNNILLKILFQAREKEFISLKMFIYVYTTNYV